METDMPPCHLTPAAWKSRRWTCIVLVLCILFSFTGCDLQDLSNPGNSSSPSNQSLPGWLKVYFTNPNPPDNLGHGIDQTVVSLLDGASQTIDVASFDFNLPSIVNALAAASQRGVTVRVVYDGANGNLELDNQATNDHPFNSIQTLKAADIALVDGGRSSGLMHDKMIIVDSKVLVMGSWNLAYNDTYRNNNNVLVISAYSLIVNYQAKFDEMFYNKRFGSKARVKVPNPRPTIDGIKVENYFAPEDGVMDKLVALVQNARQSVHLMAYSFTSPDLLTAMAERAKAGVDVQGVMETRNASQDSPIEPFCASFPILADGNPYMMHHKVIIIDGDTVITGSFNFTKSADSINDENVLVIHSPAAAAVFEQEYQRIHGASMSPQAAGIACSH